MDSLREAEVGKRSKKHGHRMSGAQIVTHVEAFLRDRPEQQYAAASRTQAQRVSTMLLQSAVISPLKMAKPKEPEQVVDSRRVAYRLLDPDAQRSPMPLRRPNSLS